MFTPVWMTQSDWPSGVFFFFFFLGGWWICCPAASQVKFKMHPSVILAGGCHEYSASFYPQVMLLWCHSDTEQTVISNV